MKKYILSYLWMLIMFTAGAQTPDSLVGKAKELIEKKDYTSAFPLLKKAAEAGSLDAQYNLGIFYENAFGTIKNDSAAAYWFLKAARQGAAEAQFKVAYAYQMGVGLPKDVNKSFFWAQKCAWQGNPECMFNVIGCYVEGLGVAKNTDSMFVWAVRLALMENTDNIPSHGMKITSARANLALMYQDGKMVRKDPAVSYMWYLIFNESKKDLALGEQQKNIELIKDLEKGLSQAEKDKAKENAEKLLGRKLANFANLYVQDY